MFVPWSDRLSPCSGCVRLLIEKRNLSGCAIALRYCRGIQRFIDACEQLRAIPPSKIKRAGLYETFQHLAISHTRIESRTKIVGGCELAALISLADGHCHCSLTDVLDCSEAVTNCIVVAAVGCGRLRVFRGAAVRDRS